MDDVYVIQKLQRDIVNVETILNIPGRFSPPNPEYAAMESSVIGKLYPLNIT